MLCRLVVRVHCQPNCTKQYSAVQCRVFSPQSMHFPIVWCAVYIHFAACSLTTNLQSTVHRSHKRVFNGLVVDIYTMWFNSIVPPLHGFCVCMDVSMTSTLKFTVQVLEAKTFSVPTNLQSTVVCEHCRLASC